MGQNHTGNTIPSITQEEHASAGGIDAKKVFVFDNAGNQITAFGSNTPTNLINGMVSAASGALVQFPTNSVQWVSVRAAIGNATTVYVGASGATINNSWPLNPTDIVGIAVNNTNQLYLVGVGTSEVRFLGAN